MFGSTWGNQQQGQPSGSAFGQPGGFGQTGAFGQTPGTFGQQQQQPQQQQPQQQPAANPMFGGFGTNPSTTQTTGFGATGGAFGQPPSNTTSVFGAPKPATGFGSTGAFGSTGFGTTAGTTTTSAFGQPSTSTTGAFGNTGIFGNKPAFGTTGQFDGAGSITTGTSNPTYVAFNEKDATNANLTLAYQSITCMPAYRGYSFEELRLQDYQQNRKAATTGGFGAGTFGSTTQPTTTGGLFGQNQPTTQPTQSAFGGGTGAFGSTGTTTGTGFGAFGQQQQQQQPQQQPQQQQQQQPSGTGFGAFSQTQPQQSTGFASGGFGTTQPQQQTGGLFSGSTFGQKPATTGFGTTTAGTGAFGTGTGAFGQTQPQTTTTFGNTPQQQPQTNAFGAGGFGTNTNKSIFGQPATGAFGSTTTGTGGGIFGQQPQQQQPAQSTTGLFGTTTGTSGTGLFGQQQQPQQTTGLFGNTQQQQPQQQQSGGLFGGQTTGLFGTTQQNQPAQQNPLGSGLFGQKTTTPGTGLVGSTPTTTIPNQTGSLFGNTLGQPQNQQTTIGFGGMFGKPATANGTATQPTMFGSTNQTPLFGVNATNSTAQGTLTAAIDQPVNTNIPIFSLLPSGPQLNSLDASLTKKKAEFFVDVPTRSSIPVVSRGTAPVNSKIRGAGRGFTSSTYLGASTNNLGSSLSFSSSKSNALSLNKSSTQRSNLITDSFSGPSFGGGNRDSVKKLVMDKKVDLFDWVPKSSDVAFNPALSVAAREKEAISGPLGATRNTPTTPTINPPSRIQARTPNRFTAQSTSDVTDEQSGEPKEGEYWSEPPMASLSSWGHNELLAIEKLVVGRVGYGKITFLDPVDLTGSGSVKQLFGDLVRFEDKECSVYPDLDNADKPPAGSGLNVRARVELDGCWPVDKATREPIKDESHPQMVKHLKRLKGMKETQFESFDMKSGKWTFAVDHF
ncbi:nucleoporin autopeptidase-domain-containing protein [Thelephora terrestris]|uniref:Nucleoporin autopeptidase-domain-containing protein n=1 Tax=Thelephora terrestris TaxID=56493 RepID=A0A9P6L2L8_9AGAM|nr:nucleoporin autopeptidase-domain-containing protein [Thelephora terrestris]